MFTERSIETVLMMQILASISSRWELIVSVLLAMTCHAAILTVIPAGTASEPQLDLAAHRRNLEITLMPSPAVERERIPDRVREKKTSATRQAVSRQPARDKVPFACRRSSASVSRQRKRIEPPSERRSPVRSSRIGQRPPRENAVVSEKRRPAAEEGGSQQNQARSAEPVMIGKVAVEYPRFAIDEGWEGRVILEILVSETGDPRRVELKRSSGHAFLDRSAVRQVRENFRFSPALEQGRPVARWLEQSISFELNNLSVSVATR